MYKVHFLFLYGLAIQFPFKFEVFETCGHLPTFHFFPFCFLFLSLIATCHRITIAMYKRITIIESGEIKGSNLGTAIENVYLKFPLLFKKEKFSSFAITNEL